jgi:DNA-binding MarR family transcriptional regulator
MRIAVVRQRNSILETLELFRDLHPGITLGNMIAFMYTCENEGLTILDLAQVSGFYLATASRTIRAFSAPDAEGAMSPALGLIEVTQTPRGKTIHLTEAGRKLRAQIEEIIAEAAPIQSPATQAA